MTTVMYFGDDAPVSIDRIVEHPIFHALGDMGLLGLEVERGGGFTIASIFAAPDEAWSVLDEEKGQREYQQRLRSRSRIPDYRRYLQTHHWQLTRHEARSRAGCKCERCGSGDRLQVHHKTYAHLWHEPPEDLEVLCRRCHAAEHGVTP